MKEGDPEDRGAGEGQPSAGPKKNGKLAGDTERRHRRPDGEKPPAKETKMYLHLGQETVVNTREVVGLFDLDTTSVSKKTREFLAKAEKDGRVVNVSTELPKSFAVMAGEKRIVYISQLAPGTLKKRVDKERG